MNKEKLAEIIKDLHKAYSSIEKALLFLGEYTDEESQIINEPISRKELQTLCLNLVRKDSSYSAKIKSLMFTYNAKSLTELNDSDLSKFKSELGALNNE